MTVSGSGALGGTPAATELGSNVFVVRVTDAGGTFDEADLIITVASDNQDPDLDTDGDGLTNGEEALLGTDPNKADTDGDGVSDWDEITVNSTNPLSATDADGDGIPDDFEKHLAKQLLEFRPDPAVWGTFYAGIAMGDLNANHDYTGDGISAAGLSSLFAQAVGSWNPQAEYLIQPQYRFNKITNAYYEPPVGTLPGGAYGQYIEGGLSGSGDITQITELTNLTDLSPAYLEGHIAGVAWVGNGFAEWNPDDLTHYSHSVAGFQTTEESSDTRYEGFIKQGRLRVVATRLNHEPFSQPVIKLTSRRDYRLAGFDLGEAVSAEALTITIPKGRFLSDWINFEPPVIEGRGTVVSLVPVEAAPDVLAVNSDFDEGRIDPATGYAIPDCDDMPGVDQDTGGGNTKLELDAERNHLDGTFTQGEDVVKDLHKGWFGVNPNTLGDDFWAGANVTIRKIDKTDDETGYKESGQVRFYAKFEGGYYGITPYDFQTLQPVNLISAGVNLRPNEGVYGASSTIPDGAEFYMEGVRPGKITLEWRYQKGTIDVKYEQTFKVETHKTRDEWLHEAFYQIRLQTKVKSGTAVNLAFFNPNDGFYANIPNVLAIDYYYRQLFQQMPEKFMWAGMAKVAEGPIYAGMSDLTQWYNGSEFYPGTGWNGRDPGTGSLINNLLLGGQKDIFQDMSWTHRAFQASGIWAIRYVVQKEGSTITALAAWETISDGIDASDQTEINKGNRDLLEREQRDVVQQDYDKITALQLRQPPAVAAWWVNAVTVPVDSAGLANAGEWLSANSNKNPLNRTSPYAPGFRATVPGGRLDTYADRWAWTSNPTNGMVEMWTGTSTAGPNLDAATRMSYNDQSMKQSATIYSNDSAMLPNE